jgi:hypothetical protein
MLYIGTGNGLFKAEGDNITALGFREEGGMRCPVVIDKDDPKVLYAGTQRAGMFRSEDGGKTWQPINNGLSRKEIWWVEQHPRTGELWAGVSPSAMFKSSDRGETWTECGSLEALPTYKEWTFPQPPHISHVKHLSLHPSDPNHVLGAVEEGWVIRSTDGGKTWENLRNGCEFDAHTVYFMPDNPRVAPGEPSRAPEGDVHSRGRGSAAGLDAARRRQHGSVPQRRPGADVATAGRRAAGAHGAGAALRGG